MDKVRWGILSTGRIAGAFADAVNQSETGELAAVGSRNEASAVKFAESYGIPRSHGSYEALLADAGVDAVYIGTPHPFHAEWAIKAAEAGKHILCEKPLTLNHAEAMAVMEAARNHDVFLMEAFMYRCHPQTAKLVELIRTRAVGEVRLIQAAFGFNAGFNADSRLYSNELGGGGILDVGCYCVSMARLVAGAALELDGPAEPEQVTGTGTLNKETGVDEIAVASLHFKGGILASLSTSITVQQENRLVVYGTEGRIVIPDPWIPGRDGQSTSIEIHRSGKELETIEIQPGAGIYTLEADTVARHLADRQAKFPAMSWDDTLGNMRTLDRWRGAIGLTYRSELPTARLESVHRRPVKRQADHPMKYGRIAGVDKDISRIVMGVDHQRELAHASVMFDDFFEHGGNCFDSAHVYSGGQCERVLGQWIKNRGLRDQVVLLDKGAHTPFCTPDGTRQQLAESLERLQTDAIDIYVLHRDNLDVPAGEFVDVLHEAAEAGQIKAFGGSNWSLDRIDEANAYAKANGRRPFGVVSNNFSLARLVEPVWAGCISASDPESRAWFERTQTPLFSWSSQAHGFFVRAAVGDLSDPELARCWYSDDNFRRQGRVMQLAKERGVRPINVALAYVLCQPFPTFALVGPRTLAETRTSLPALGIELSEQDRRWLNLEVESR